MENQKAEIDDINSYSGTSATYSLRVFAIILFIVSIVAGIWYISNFKDLFLGIIIISSGILTTIVFCVLAAICENLMFIRYYLAKKDK